MPMTGQLGALGDPDPSVPTGALCTCIGFGINAVFGPPTHRNFDPGPQLRVQRIGGGSQTVESPSFAGKAVSVSVNSTGAAIATGAAMPSAATTRAASHARRAASSAPSPPDPGAPHERARPSRPDRQP